MKKKKLKKALNRFFEILEITEESSNTYIKSHPVRINCRRVQLSEELDEIMEVMKEFTK